MDLQEKYRFLTRVRQELESIALHPEVQKKVPEALEAWQFWDEKGSILLPQDYSEEEHGFLPDKDGQPLILYLMPGDKEDEQHTEWGEHIRTTPLTSYMSSEHIIFFRLPFPDTPRFAAFYLLYEIWRAMNAEKDGRAGRRDCLKAPLAERIEEECVLGIRSMDIMLALGGSSYERILVDGAIISLKGRVDLRGSGSLLNFMFGEIVDSQVGAIYRESLFGTHILLKTCELQGHSTDDEIRKAQHEVLKKYVLDF